MKESRAHLPDPVLADYLMRDGDGIRLLTTTMNVYQHELDDGLGGAGELDGIWGHPGATDVPQTAANDAPAEVPETVD